MRVDIGGCGVTQSAELFLPKLTAAYPGVNIRVSALNGKQGLLGFFVMDRGLIIYFL